jgi:hypothetical protein
MIENIKPIESLTVLEKMLGLLAKALRDPLSRKETVDEFLQCYFENQLLIKRSIGQDAYDIFGDLNFDLHFFVADPAWRAQDSSYYGDERLEQQIGTALQRLARLGIALTADKA